MENQPSLHGVAVHVFQLLFEFLLAPNVEVIKPSLPEMSFLNLDFGKLQPELPFRRAFASLPEAPGNLLLEHLQGYGWIAPGWFAQQKMNVLRHHHESQEQEISLGTHPREDFQKAVSRARGSQQRPPPVTTEGHEVQIALAVVASQRVTHQSQNPHP